MKYLNKNVLAIALLVTAGASNAAVDTAAVVTAIGDAVAPAVAVGVASIVAYAGIWAFKLIKRLL